MNPDQNPWAINLQAKSKYFNFKFKSTRYLPACYNFIQFSIFLKISSLIVQVSSDNHQPTRPKSFRSKINGFIEKLQSKLTKRKTFAAHSSSRIKKLKWVSFEGPICASTVVIGNLALLIHSISKKDVKGMIVHCFSILLYILTLLKIFIRTKNSKLMLISVLAMVAYPLWLYMNNSPSYGLRTFGWRYIWKTWNWAASHGLLHAIAQLGGSSITASEKSYCFHVSTIANEPLDLYNAHARPPTLIVPSEPGRHCACPTGLPFPGLRSPTECAPDPSGI
ncbi:hypothetical protein QVD17_27605 [Tagetes erecta]|uniref:Uncharacterized protein n=1 Tax=Tagetes erecta TaxID=13708 RepID=A0AAD8K8T1_TARER|nr:hypothetical protein QVD17_27605 [Tagetes erecta]